MAIEMKRLRIGLIGIMQPSFCGNMVEIYKRSVAAMSQLGNELEYDLLYMENGIITETDAEAAINRFKNENIDFLMVQASSFIGGSTIAPIVRSGYPIGIWAVPEPAKEGPIPLNSFCGMNMMTSILRNFYKKYNVKYKWYYGMVDNNQFLKRWKITVSSLKAIKKLKEAKIALIGGIAPGFLDFYIDKRNIESRLGIRIYDLHDFEEIKNKALSYKDEELKQLQDDIYSEACSISTSVVNKMNMIARTYKALEDFAVENGYDALAVSCWPKFRKELGIVPCSVIGRLNDNGIVTACEGDVESAVSMLLLKTISNNIPMLMDLSDIDEKDESILLWHCGSGPKCYANRNGLSLKPHYKKGKYVAGADNIEVAAVNDMIFSSGVYTSARFTGDGSRIINFTGRFMDDGKPSFDGSRGWMNDITADGNRVGIWDLINTIMLTGIQHHYPIVKGDVSSEISELAYWLNIDKMDIVKYKDYMI